MKYRNMAKWAGILAVTGLVFYAPDVFAADSAPASSLQDVAKNMTGTFGALAQLITAIAYIAGLGFALASVLKFKAHKDNPTQIPVGTPIALLFVAAALMFLPTLFGVAGSTIFGKGAQTGGISGTSSFVNMT